MFNIVLLEPEIPANTGNIGRTCLAAGASLHLIEPLGFRLTERMIARAGMDYWDQVDLHRYRDYEDFTEQNPDASVYMLTTKAERDYTEIAYKPGDFLMFGKESAGIPEELLVENRARCVRIPMAPGIRSLNLSNAAAIVLYEALRQNRFGGLQTEGALHRLSWERN